LRKRCGEEVWDLFAGTGYQTKDPGRKSPEGYPTSGGRFAAPDGTLMEGKVNRSECVCWKIKESGEKMLEILKKGGKNLGPLTALLKIERT